MGFPKTSFSVLPTDVITLTGTFAQAVSFSTPASPSPLIYHYRTQRMFTSLLTTWVLHAPIPTVILIIYLLIITQLYSRWLWSHGEVCKRHTAFVLKLKDSFVGHHIVPVQWNWDFHWQIVQKHVPDVCTCISFNSQIILSSVVGLPVNQFGQRIVSIAAGCWGVVFPGRGSLTVSRSPRSLTSQWSRECYRRTDQTHSLTLTSHAITQCKVDRNWSDNWTSWTLDPIPDYHSL